MTSSDSRPPEAGRIEPLECTFARLARPVDCGRAATGAVAVALVDLEFWRPWLAEAVLLLDTEELARAHRQRLASHREALLLTYGLHRLWLGRVLQVPAKDVPIGRDPVGCPILAGGRYATSLSHSGGFAAFAATNQGPVGIDIEPLSRAPTLPEIADAVCSPGEAGHVSALGIVQRGRALLDLWIRKEAMLKAAGVGLAVEMTSFDAPLETLVSVPEGADVHLQVSMVDAAPRARAAVARAPGVKVHAHWLHSGKNVVS